MPERIAVAVITTAAGAHLDAYIPSLAATKEVESVVLADPDAAGKRRPAKRSATGWARSIGTPARCSTKRARPWR